MAIECASFSKPARLKDLAEAVRFCSLCQRMASRTRVLSDSNGNVNSKVLFVAEAPGRLGADRTGVPLCGDRTGDNFELLLSSVGWRRTDVFVSNAVLCNPREENGSNGTPRPDEVSNCATFLRMTVELVQPQVVVSLGAVALKALGVLAPHNQDLARDVGEPSPWNGRLLVPLYHPGPRALVHRSEMKQRADFRKLARLVHPQKGIVRRRASTPSASAVDVVREPPNIHQLILAITAHLKRTSYFKLTKLIYLADLRAQVTLGHTITEAIHLRAQEGPWSPALPKAIRTMSGHEVTLRHERGLPFVVRGPSPRFGVTLEPKIMSVVADVLDVYGGMTNAQIKVAAYHTGPMKSALALEKAGKNTRSTVLLGPTRAATRREPSEPSGEKSSGPSPSPAADS